jgi:hypothetical protein
MANEVEAAGNVPDPAVNSTTLVEVAAHAMLADVGVAAHVTAATAANTSWVYVHVILPPDGTMVVGVRAIATEVGVAPATRVLSVDAAVPVIAVAETPETQVARMATEVYFILS